MFGKQQKRAFLGAGLCLMLATMAPAPATADEVADLEAQTWGFAQEADTQAAYQLFLKNFPNSPYRVEAARRLEEVMDRDNRLAKEEDIFALLGPVTYDSPLMFGNDSVLGLTIPEVLQTSPLFPPVEGLPEALWKEQSCANCHSWDREMLCTQGQTYLGMDPNRYQEKPHPFGGAFKVNLRQWATNDCQ